LDDAPIEERRTRAVQLRRTLGADVGADGVLDAATIERVTAESWPDPRDADELHDALLTLVRLAPLPPWQGLFDELAAAGRASVHGAFWLATEREAVADDADTVVRGWMELIGPVTAGALAARVAFDREAVEAALVRMEVEGQVLRGHFRESQGEMEWCNRRILARIHRATLAGLRREIEPVAALELQRFLERWQHVSAGSRLHGTNGTLEVIRQLQGYEISAAAWEAEILARRVAGYKPEFLDELCLCGEVMWARLSRHPALDENRRVRPTRLTPVSLFLREDAEWLMAGAGQQDPEGLSPVAQDLLAALERTGASFFVDLRRQTGRLASEVEDGLWELLAGGLVTADGFDNLRALIDPKRRAGGSRRPRHAAGRWALVRQNAAATVAAEKRIEHFAEQLLARWGVLMRDLLARETVSPPWRDVVPTLRRMEARGEIRGGRFVAGLTGEQFARPEALDLLRALRREGGAAPAGEISNADPLNLAGIVLPGPRVSRLAAW
jgi:ATP-dependent Lhr-like helicase